jgi:hypothetical protein
MECSDDHRGHPVQHERIGDGTTDKPSMAVTLVKVD